MTHILDAAALLVVAAGLVTFASAATLPGLRRDVVGLALEFWTAAGLLRLSATRTWTALLTAAVILGVRRIVVRTWSRTRPSLPRP